jgi:hypothetical protein
MSEQPCQTVGAVRKDWLAVILRLSDGRQAHSTPSRTNAATTADHRSDLAERSNAVQARNRPSRLASGLCVENSHFRLRRKNLTKTKKNETKKKKSRKNKNKTN